MNASLPPKPTGPKLLQIALIASLVITSRPAASQSILQVDPEETTVMIQKDFGSERWSIVYDRERGTALGNVFKTDGSEPSFLWCETASETRTDVTFDCWGADKCIHSHCPASRPDGSPAWTSLGRQKLARSFFETRDRQYRACEDWTVRLETSGSRNDRCALRLVLDNEACATALTGLSGTVTCEGGGSGPLDPSITGVPAGDSASFEFEAPGCIGDASVTVTSGGVIKTSAKVSCNDDVCGGFAHTECSSTRDRCHFFSEGCDVLLGGIVDGVDCVGFCIPLPHR